FFSEEKIKEEILKNLELRRQAKKTAYEGVATEPSLKPISESFKKTNEQVISSSTVPDSTKPHHKRANTFAFNFHNFDNKDNIRGTLVSQKTEGKLGLTGLVQYIIDNSDLSTEQRSKIDLSKYVVMVMTNEKGELLGVDGEVLESPSLEHTIFQSMPPINLKWLRDGGSMFRKETKPEDVEALTKKYATTINRVLASENPISHPITPSFGIWEYMG